MKLLTYLIGFTYCLCFLLHADDGEYVIVEHPESKGVYPILSNYGSTIVKQQQQAPISSGISLLNLYTLHQQGLLKNNMKLAKNIQYVQLNTIDQFKPIFTHVSRETCPIQAARNAGIMIAGLKNDMVLPLLTNEQNALAAVQSAQKACKIFTMATSEEVQELVVSNIVPSLKSQDVTVIENILYVTDYKDVFPQLTAKFDYLRNKFISMPQFYHAFIVGTGDNAQSSEMHWFAVVIAKVDNYVQVLLADTSPNRPHFQAGDPGLERIKKLVGYFFPLY